MTGETCQVKGKHSRLAFGQSERGRSRSTRRRSRRHRIRSDRHGGNFTVRDSRKGPHFFFPTVKISKKGAERRFFRNDSPRNPTGGDEVHEPSEFERSEPHLRRACRSERLNRGSPIKSKPRRRRVHREIRGSRNRRVPVDARSSEHRAPSRFANPHGSRRGTRRATCVARASLFPSFSKCDR